MVKEPLLSSTTTTISIKPPPPPPPLAAITPSQKSSRQLLLRGLTILVLAPSVFYLISMSRASLIAVVYTVICLCSFEWSGLKRHLKVAVLLSKSGSRRGLTTFSTAPYTNVTHTTPPRSPPTACMRNGRKEEGNTNNPNAVDPLSHHHYDPQQDVHGGEDKNTRGTGFIFECTEEGRKVGISSDPKKEYEEGRKRRNEEDEVGMEVEQEDRKHDTHDHTFSFDIHDPIRQKDSESKDLMTEGEGEEEDSHLCNLTVKEFAYPVPTLTVYNLLKHLSWAHFAVAAGGGSLAFLVLLSAYFLIFVGVTIIAHNRLEFKVEEAMDRLLEMGPVASLRENASGFFSKSNMSFSGSIGIDAEAPVSPSKNITRGKENESTGGVNFFENLEGTKRKRGKEQTERMEGGVEEGREGEKGEPDHGKTKYDTMNAAGVKEEGNNVEQEVDLPWSSSPTVRRRQQEGSLTTTTTTSEGSRLPLKRSSHHENLSTELPPSLLPSFSISSLFYHSEKEAEKTRAEQERFARLELSVIVQNQPAEQFVDFCLDIFGWVWISLFATSILVYDIPVIGFPWICATLAGNFANDIMALLVGKTVKGLKRAFFYPSSSPDGKEKRGGGKCSSFPSSSSSSFVTPNTKIPSTSTNHLKEKKSGSGSSKGWWGKVEQFMGHAPHPLYLTISPNKSVEGALAGVLSNTLVFVLVLSSWPFPSVVSPSPNVSLYGNNFSMISGTPMTGEGGLHGGDVPPFTSSLMNRHHQQPPLPQYAQVIPRFHCFPVWVLAGFILGVAGVVGDLLQSLLKRVSRVKDTGSLLPGHGGMLDRVDGLLLAFPTMFFLIHLVLAME